VSDLDPGDDGPPEQFLNHRKGVLDDMVQFQMNGQRQVQASEALIQAAVAGRLQHPGHPDLDAHSSHSTTITETLGARIVRAHREPIDAITCLSMCAVRAQAPHKRVRLLTPAH
jgi:hypothetical protein